MIAHLQVDSPELISGEAHGHLAHFNARRLQPCGPGCLPDDAQDSTLLKWEKLFLTDERKQIADLAAQAPTDPVGFLAWFTALEANGPGQGDPLFPWLAEHAGLQDMRWFLTQEAAGEAGFDDLVAMTQVKLPERSKLELARNYWDEMGRGRESGMHGPMLDRLASDLRLSARDHAVTWEAVAIGNLLMGLAANRGYAFHSVGALGVVELTAPSRAAHVAAGLERLNVAQRSRRYYALHATLDVRHSAAWNEEVIRPLVREDPATARSIAEGALMRLSAGARCFARYRRELGISA